MKDIKTKDLAIELLEKFNEQYPNGDSYELVKFVIDYCKEVKDFYKLIQDKIATYPSNWRKGQKVFNAAEECLRELTGRNIAREVQFEDNVDCFYDDDAIDDFLNHCWIRFKSNNIRPREYEVLDLIEETADSLADHYGMNVPYTESIDMSLFPVVIDTMLDNIQDGDLSDLQFLAQNNRVFPKSLAEATIDEFKTYCKEHRDDILNGITNICLDYIRPLE